MPTPTYTLIASNTLTSTAASVTFSDIPQTFTDLVLRVSARNNDTQTWGHLHLRFNSDTTSNYSYTYLAGNGSTTASATSGNNVSTRAYYAVDGNTATSNTFGSVEVYIPNYNSTSAKPIGTFGVNETNSSTAGDANIAATAALYRGGSGISSITLGASSNFSTVSFLSGSSFFLYGVKNS